MKVAPLKELNFIELGDEAKGEIGEKAYALGNPFGYKSTFSDGIVSQKVDRIYRKLIGFTCPISPGSSGCPLINARRQAIGIVTQSTISVDGIPMEIRKKGFIQELKRATENQLKRYKNPQYLGYLLKINSTPSSSPV